MDFHRPYHTPQVVGMESFRSFGIDLLKLGVQGVETIFRRISFLLRAERFVGAVIRDLLFVE
jgi:hypothetical protein